MASTSKADTKPKRTVTKVAPSGGVEPENRDPNSLNQHIKIQFYDVLGEPESLRSFDCTWEFSEVFYDCCRTCWYQLITFFCGICIAIYWGCEFAPVSFVHIWYFTPFSQLVKIVCGVWCRGCWTILIRCFVSPCARACAPFFRMCGDGLDHRPESPSWFPKRAIRPKPVVEKKPESPKAVVVEKNIFGDYDKEKMAKSVRRQLML